MSYPIALVSNKQYRLIEFDIVARLKCVDTDADSSTEQPTFDRIKHLLNHVKLKQRIDEIDFEVKSNNTTHSHQNSFFLLENIK